MLYFKLYNFTLLKQSRSFTLLFMYLELLQYQLSNNLPQSAQTLDFDLKSCFVQHFQSLCLLLTGLHLILSLLLWFAQHLELLCSFLTCLRFNLSSFILLNTESLCSFIALFRLSQPFLLCVENLELLCLLFSFLWRLSK